MKAQEKSNGTENSRADGHKLSSTNFANILSIGYGDTVVLKDLKSGETFNLKLEANPGNRNLMKDIELRLLGLQLNQSLNYSGDSYKIVDIQKCNYIQ